MIAALWLMGFVALLLIEHRLQAWWESRQAKALKRHATREAIRQEMGLDRWSRGEMWPNHGRRWTR